MKKGFEIQNRKAYCPKRRFVFQRTFNQLFIWHVQKFYRISANRPLFWKKHIFVILDNLDVIKFKPIYFVIITVILIQQSSLSCFGQKIRYQRIEIPFDKEILTQVQSLGIPIDFINRKQMMVFEISELEAKLLKNSKISYNVVIDDLEKYYRERNSGKNPAEILLQQRQSKGYTIPDGFELGSMGGCCKLDEMLTHLDFMAENYPELISPRLPAGDRR